MKRLGMLMVVAILAFVPVVAGAAVVTFSGGNGGLGPPVVIPPEALGVDFNYFILGSDVWGLVTSVNGTVAAGEFQLTDFVGGVYESFYLNMFDSSYSFTGVIEASTFSLAPPAVLPPGVPTPGAIFAGVGSTNDLFIGGASIGFSPFDFQLYLSETTFPPVDGAVVYEIQAFNINLAPVPEPGTMVLLGSGLVGLAGWGRKKFRR